MQPKFLIEESTLAENLNQVMDAIVSLGFKYKTLKYKPFIEEQEWPYNPHSEECIVAIGSINLVRQVQRHTKWVPGTFANWENYKFTTYCNYYKDYLLNSEFAIYPYKYIIDHFNLIRRSLHANDLFIKSDDGTKIFAGGVFSGASSMQTRMTSCKDNTLCVVAPALQIHSEYRFFVYQDDILTGSMYYNTDGQIDPRGFDKLNEDEKAHFIEARKYLQDMLKNVAWRPEDIFVADIGFIGYGGKFLTPRLIEINAASCSGWYDCDPNPIILALSSAATTEWRNIYECN